MIDHPRLWSLWDMLTLRAGELVEIASTVSARHMQAMAEMDAGVVFQWNVPGLTPEGAFKDTLKSLGRLCVGQQLRVTANLAAHNLKAYETREATAGARLAVLADLSSVLRDEISKQHYIQLLSGREVYLDRDNLFGKNVYERFPSARHDVRDAGNCFALEQYTACVFHLMRAAEVGLRVLAWDRRVVLRHKGKVLRVALELVTWDKILRGLEDAEHAIENYRKTPTREQQLAFYHGAMVELRAFKNLFRNRFMHTRDESDYHRAAGAMLHVQTFMSTLAGRLSEQERTPMCWTDKWLASAAH